MNLIKAKGIVIRRTDVGDYDRMLSVLTADMGRISVFVKGARSLRRRGAQGIDLLCYSEFVLKPLGDIHALSQSSVIEGFYHLRDSVEKLAYAMYFADLAGRVCGEFEGCGEGLRLLLNTLYYLANKNSPPDALKLFFELRILALAGFEPQLGECVVCAGGEGAMFFDAPQGGMVCKKCAGARSVSLSPAAVCEMQRILSSGLGAAINALPGAKTVKEAQKALEDFLAEHMGAPPKTLGYLKTIVG